MAPERFVEVGRYQVLVDIFFHVLDEYFDTAVLAVLVRCRLCNGYMPDLEKRRNLFSYELLVDAHLVQKVARSVVAFHNELDIVNQVGTTSQEIHL